MQDCASVNLKLHGLLDQVELIESFGQEAPLTYAPAMRYRGDRVGWIRQDGVGVRSMAWIHESHSYETGLKGWKEKHRSFGRVRRGLGLQRSWMGREEGGLQRVQLGLNEIWARQGFWLHTIRTVQGQIRCDRMVCGRMDR